MTHTNYDVVIAGGGLAGLSLARQLAQANQDLQILVLEKSRHPLAPAAVKVGESTVEIGAHYFTEMLNLQQHIDDAHLPKYGLRFYYKDLSQPTLADGTELGLTRRFPTPSYQLERGTLENFLAKTLADQRVDFLDRASIRHIDIAPTSGPHHISYQHAGSEHQVTCRWFVDATGRRQLLKRNLGTSQDVAHSMNAVWFRIDERLKVDDFEDLYPLPGPITIRWISTNHLMGAGYWVWLIPLAGGATSVGIVADPTFHPMSDINSFDKALAWLHRHQPTCGKVIEQHRDKLMDFLALKNFSYGCEQVFSADRWAMTGEAGVFADPFYSPGSDFIGMSNTLITEMILADRRKRPPNAMIQAYNDLYLNLFHNTLTVYRGQYAMFGNPIVMSAKVAWDYTVYWSFPALAFCQGRLGQLALDFTGSSVLTEMGALNLRMQKFFRKWHELYQPRPIKGMVDLAKFKLLDDLNAELNHDLDDDAFQAALQKNLERLRALSYEMIQTAAADYPEMSRYLMSDEPPAFNVQYADFHHALHHPICR